MRRETPLETHALENGLQLEIFDESTRMASDRWRIRLVMRIAVDVATHFRSDASETGPALDALMETIGQEVIFESVRQRVFVEDRLKSEVIADLTGTVLQDLAPYLGGPGFPQQFILKCYRDQTG